MLETSSRFIKPWRPFKHAMKSLLAFILVLEAFSGYCQSYQYSGSKLSPALPKCEDIIGKLGYRQLYGVSISNYYALRDSLSISYGDNEFPDKILILSPITQEFGRDTLLCDQPRARRLLVLLKPSGRDYYISQINENLIPDNYDYQNEPYCGITLHGKLLQICIYTGSKVRCERKFYFEEYHHNLYLTKDSIDCYTIDLSKRQMHTFEYNIADSNNIANINIQKYLEDPADLW